MFICNKKILWTTHFTNLQLWWIQSSFSLNNIHHKIAETFCFRFQTRFINSFMLYFFHWVSWWSRGEMGKIWLITKCGHSYKSSRESNNRTYLTLTFFLSLFLKSKGHNLTGATYYFLGCLWQAVLKKLTALILVFESSRFSIIAQLSVLYQPMTDVDLKVSLDIHISCNCDDLL